MIVQDLRQRHGSSAVAAIFMKSESSGTPEGFATDVLESIYFQLTDRRYKNDAELQTSEGRMKELENLIYKALHAIPCAFLVVDDLDSCGYHSVKLIEEKLDTLQKHGLRTMITSRIARYPTIRWFCDAGGAHGIEADCDVWFCNQCYQQAEKLEGEEREDMVDDLFVTCTTCKEKDETKRICSKYVIREINANFQADGVESVPTNHRSNCAVPITMRN